MLRQYFKSVPESLEEAAYVDGCSTLHTFVKIMLPDAVPTIASCFLFSFVWQWTDLPIHFWKGSGPDGTWETAWTP